MCVGVSPPCTICLYLSSELLLLCSVRFFFLHLELKVVVVGLLQVKALSELLLKSSSLLLPLPLLLLLQVQLCTDPIGTKDVQMETNPNTLESHVYLWAYNS